MNREQAGELAASLESREVSQAGIAALGAIVTAYRRLDDEIGSATLRPLVQHNLQVTKGLRAKSNKVRRQLGVVAADFYQLAGWLAFDASDYATARRHYGTALKLADQTGDARVACRMLSDISYLETTARNPSEGIRAAESGLDRAAKTSSRTLRSSAAIFKARAHAEAGHSSDAKAAIGMAEEELCAAKREDDPSFIYYFDRAVLDAHAGLTYAALGEPQPANDALSRAVEAIPPTFVRRAALYRAYRAHVLALANETPEACRIAAEAADLLDQASSTRTTKLLKELHQVQLRPYWRSPAVRELGDRLYAL